MKKVDQNTNVLKNQRQMVICKKLFFYIVNTKSNFYMRYVHKRGAFLLNRNSSWYRPSNV